MTKVSGVCGNYDLNATTDIVTATGEDVSGALDAHARIGNSFVLDINIETVDNR